MNILQINTADKGGGAEGSAYNLHCRFRKAGHHSMMAVGTRLRDDADVYEIPREAAGGMVSRLTLGFSNALRKRQSSIPGGRKMARIIERLSCAERMHEWRNGLEEYAFPGCRKLLDILPVKPDIIHCHNLHGWFFDLRLLPELSRQFPFILNLRDTWAFSGHCAYFMDCNKWLDGCHNCPDISIYPPIRLDNAHENWQRKKDIFEASRLFVTAPSKWMIDEAKRSILRAVEYKVIPNGIDTDLFSAGDKARAREELNLPIDAQIVMFASAAAKTVFKDPDTLVECVHILAHNNPKLYFLCIGTQLDGLNDIGNIIRFPFISSPQKMAMCYQAADVFVHTARAEAFGKTVAESMACGTPVAATDVGGIPEQIIPGRTGLLAPLKNAEKLAEQVQTILSLPPNAWRDDCVQRGAQFSLQKQANAFLCWYQEIIQTIK